MPVSVFHALSATSPDATSAEIRPSAWNSQHVATLALVGSEVIGAFASGTAAGNVSFGTNTGGNITAHAPTIVVAAGTNSVSSGTVSFANSNGITFGMAPNGAITATVIPGAAAGIAAFQDSAQTGTSGTLYFQNANNVSFGLAGNSQLTASASFPAQQPVAVSGSNGSLAFSTLSLENSNGLSFYTTNGGLAASYTVPNAAVSGSNGSFAFSTLSLGNLNGLSFYTSGSSLVASYTVPVQSVQPVAVSASNGSLAFSTLSLSNSNGLSFYTTNGAVVGSYSVPSTAGLLSAINVSAGLASTNVSAIDFVNLNGVSFGQNNGTITASVAAPASVSAGTTNAVLGQLVLSNSNGVSFGLAGSTVTASIVSGGVAVSAGASSQNSGTVAFSNSNNMSFGLNGGTLTASASFPAQSAQTLGLYASSQTVGQSSSTTVDARSLSFVGQGAVSVGASAGSFLVSAPVQSVQTQNLHDITLGGNTSGALALVSSGTLSLAGGNNITLSQNGNAITISGANLGGAQTGISGVVVSNTTYSSGTITFQNANGISFGSSGANGISASYTVPVQSFGVSTGGNTSGNTGTQSGQVVLAGGNNITLSVSTGAGGAQSITISGANAGGAQTGISGVIVSNTTYTSGTVSFVNANGISFGSSGANGISAAYTVPTQSNQTVGIFAGGNTTQNSSSTFDARSLTFAGLGEVTVGMSNGSIEISAPPSSIGVSNIGNTSGNTGTYSGQAVFVGGNNITLSVGTAVGGAQTITISGGNAGVTGISGLQVSNTTYTSGTVSFVNANGISFGSSGANGVSASYTVPTGTTTTTQAGSTLGATLSTNGLSLAVPAWITTAAVGGVDVTLGGNTTGTLALISTGTLFLAGGNNVTLSQNGNSVTISANTAAAANLSVSAGTTTGAFGGLTFSNSNSVSFGLNNGTITASIPAQSAQTVGIYASSQTVGQSSSSTVDARSLTLVGQGNVSVGASGGSVLISAPTQTVQTQNLHNLTLAGNTAGVLAQVSSGTLTLAGGNNITLSQNGNAITISGANAGGAQTGISGLQVSNTTYTSGTVTFQNANGISFGSSGANGISASYTVPSTAGLISAVNFSAGTTSGNIGSVVFSNGNGISFGLNGSTITGSVSQSNQTEGRYALGNTTGQSSSSTFDARTLSISGAGGVSVGYSGNALVISGGAGSSQTEAIYIAGNTTGQSSQSTYTVGSLNISASGVVSVGWSSNTLVFSAPGTTGLTQLSAGFSTGGNTAGTTGLASAQLVLAGGANITLSGSTNAGSMTVSIVGGAGGGFSGGVSTGGNTSGNTGTYTGQVVFAGGNNITLSVSSGAAGAQTITVSGANAQTGLSGLQVSNTTYTSGTVTFQNANGISFGSSGANGISASANFGILAAQVSNTTYTSGTLTFQNANGISFGSSGANGISASYTVPAQTNQTLGLYAVGNTTQNSSTTLDARSLSFDGLGAMTVGYSGGSIQMSAPAVSSISGTGQVSVSVNGSTISIGVPSLVTNTDFYAPYEDIQLAPTQIGQGSLIIDPQPFPNVQFDRLFFPIYNTNSIASSGSHSLSFYAGIYSRNVSTLSLIGSTSLTTAITQSGTVGSYSLYSGVRGFTVGSTTTLTAGNYWIGFASRTSSAGADGSYSNMALNGGFFTDAAISGTLSYGGYFGSAVNATNQVVLGQGFYTATTTGIPASIAFSQINGTASNAGNMQGIVFASSTV